MKTRYLFTAVALAAFLPLSMLPASASTHVAAKGPAPAVHTVAAAKAPSGRLPRDAKGIPTVALPYSFHCSHCGLLMTIKTQADWTKNCPMCGCNEPAYKCLPKGK